MLITCVSAAEMPPRVQEEKLPDGKRRFVLSDGFVPVKSEDNEQSTMVQGRQADFVLGTDRTETASDVEADFDGWWGYAVSWRAADDTPTTDERLNALEEAVLALIGG